LRWRKLGLVYVPDGSQPWARSHAMLPTPVRTDEDRLRIYLASTDGSIVSRVGFIDVHWREPTRVLYAASEPILDIGDAGAFDDSGVNASSVVPVGSTLRMYYVGYQLQRKIPYTLFTGLAVADSIDGPFERASRTPLLDRRDPELFFRTAPFVLPENGRWRMWYIGGGGWLEVAAEAPCLRGRYQVGRRKCRMSCTGRGRDRLRPAVYHPRWKLLQNVAFHSTRERL
jgi:hypothetical protein